MNAVDTVLYSTLTGGTALTALLANSSSVFHTQAPRGAAFPYVVLQLQGGGDQNASPHRRKELLYTVKAITATSMQDAGTIDNQIDALLHGATLTVTNWTNISTMREGDIAYIETTDEGRNYYHNGGTYRVRVGQ